MRRNFKKTLALASSAAIIATAITVPITASAAEYSGLTDIGSTAKFDFGAAAASDSSWIQVTADAAYTDSLGYGFLGQSDETYGTKAVIDGYSQTADNKTSIQNGGSGELTDYVYTEDVNMPIRFAVKTAEDNTYYKIKVTMGSSDKDSKIYLTSERRHFVILNETIAAGNTLTKEFTVAVHNVQWKDRAANLQPTYHDNMINVCVYGENALINTIEITRIAKPKVVWVFGDSTVTDAGSSLPWFGFNTYTGWGAAVAHYLPSDAAVVNLAEGGLSTSNQSYFNVGLSDFAAGDIVLMQMGHNESSPTSFIKNVADYYYPKTAEKGAEFVLVSPIERLNQYSTADYETVGSAFAAEKSIPFVPLHSFTKEIYNNLGGTAQWYTHYAAWTGTASNPKADNDATHSNDYGADMFAAKVFASLASQSESFSVLAPYVTAYSSVAVMEPSDEIMKGGTNSYVKPPNALFPYPATSIDYPNIVDITSAEAASVDGQDYLKSYTTVRHSDLPYITGFAAAYNADGSLAAVIQNRLEPMAAKTVETVNLVSDTNPNGLAIPKGGSYKTFVWEGAFSDGSMTCVPYSEAFSGYDYLNENITTSDSSGVYKLAEAVTSGKVIAEFNITPNSGNTGITLSPNESGSSGITLTINSTTGAVSFGNNIVIDGVKAGGAYDAVLIYDIDYGILTINVDGVGIVKLDIPNAVTTSGINPSQIAAVAFSGDSAVNSFKVSTLKTDALPEKTITINYDSELGEVIAPAGAVKNSRVTIKAEPDTANNVVFGGWYDADGVLFSKDAQTTFYLVDDITLKADMYEQHGVEGVASYDIKADAAVKVPKSGTAEVALDIDNIKDGAGNPVADFDHSGNVTWSLENAADGVTIEGSTLKVASDAAVDLEDVLNVKVKAVCNGVEETAVILVHNCTNLVYNENFESGTAGEAVTGWNDWVGGRYTAKYNNDGNNTYLDIQPTGNNNATGVTSVLADKLDGVVQIKTDILLNHATNQSMSVHFSDSTVSTSSKTIGNPIISIAVDTAGNYTLNGNSLEVKPGDKVWATLTAVMNFNTKTVDIKYTSLDGNTIYFDQEAVPFASSAATNFNYFVFGTGRYNGYVQLDNIIVNQIADSTESGEISADPDSVEITDMNDMPTVSINLPENWNIAKAVSGDETIVTAEVAGSNVTIMPVKEGDTSITVTACSNENKYIKNQIVIPVSVKMPGNANLSGLSLVTDSGSELIDSFDMETEVYEVKTEKAVSSITVTPVKDSSAASYVISYNGSRIEGNTVNIEADASEQNIAVVVTAADGETTKEYTIAIDNSYEIAENFAKASGTWGFDYNASVSNGMLELTIEDKKTSATKVLGASIGSLNKVNVSFDWKSLVQSDKSRDSYFALRDENGSTIFGLYGKGSGSGQIAYFTTSVDSKTKLTGFSQNWYSVDLTIDFEAKTLSGTIKNAAGETIKTFESESIGDAANLYDLYARQGYSLSHMGLDNIYIKAVTD